MRELKRFAGEAIETARDVGEEKREQARQASMREIERRQTGQTKRTAMALASKEKMAGLDRKVATPAGTTKKVAATGMLTASQMAAHREGALKQAGAQIDAKRDFKGNIINPATQLPMTPAEETNYVKMTADSILEYSLGGGVEPTVGAETQPSGTVTTEGGRSFEVTGGRRGFIETTPPATTPGVAPPVVAPGVAPPVVAPGVAPPMSPPAGRATAAKRLRTEFEKKRQTETPSLPGAIGSGATKFVRRIAQMPSSTPATAPLGLRGYMQNAYR